MAPSTTRDAIVAKALELAALPVPYAHGQASRWGCDCIGLLRLIAAELGLEDTSAGNPGVRKYLGYGREPDPKAMKAALDQFMVAANAPRAGCALWLQLSERSQPRHLAIAVPAPNGQHGTWVVHAVADRHRIVTHPIPETWTRAAIHGIYDFLGLPPLISAEPLLVLPAKRAVRRQQEIRHDLRRQKADR